jgi:virulence factor Mce-like protein
VISRRIAINLAAFLIVAVLLVLYGIVDLFGNPLEHHRKAVATFPSAGGLHPHFLVSLQGVPVGEITSIKLGENGVKVSMSFDKGTHVPADVVARVIRSSPVGEQRIDLTTTDGGRGELPNGADIPIAKTDAVPPDVGQVLDDVRGLLDNLPTGDLNQLIHETAVGLSGRADDLKSIVDSLTTLSHAYLQHQDSFRQLLATSPTLLNGLADSGAQLQSGLERTHALTQLLANRRYDLVKLFDDLTSLGTVGDSVIQANRTNLTCILSDVADLSQFLQGSTLANLSTGLRLNLQFFGLVDKISPQGYAKDLGLNAPTRDDQTWLRVRTLIPPAQPPAASYSTKLPVSPIKMGAACRNVYGNGAPAVSQAGFKPLYGAQVIQPTEADAEAPKAALTGPAGASSATPAALASIQTGAPAPRATSGGADLALLLLGIVTIGLLVIAVPYFRYRWRD